LPPDPSKPDEERTVGLELVDGASKSGRSFDASGSAPSDRQTDRRGLPIWLFVAALILFSLAIGWQAQVASELEAEVAGLEAQLERTNALLDAHRTHLSEIRGGVHELSDRLQGLRELVDRHPTDPTEPAQGNPESSVPTP